MEGFPSGGILFPALVVLLFEGTFLLCVLADFGRYIGRFLL